MTARGTDGLTIGELLERQRIKAAMSQRELSRRFGWSPPDVNRYVRGEVLPDVGRLPAIAKFLGLPVDVVRNQWVKEDAERRGRRPFAERVEALETSVDQLSDRVQCVVETLEELVERVGSLTAALAPDTDRTSPATQGRRLSRRPR